MELNRHRKNHHNDAIEDMDLSSETVDATTNASEEVEKKAEDVKQMIKTEMMRHKNTYTIPSSLELPLSSPELSLGSSPESSRN